MSKIAQGPRNPISRRRFIASATAGAAAPFILPSRIWSAQTPPNERITLGLIGMGKQMHGHLRRGDWRQHRDFLSPPQLRLLLRGQGGLGS